jgi:hypothetical protein
VRKSVRVKAPVARSFDVFTSGLSRWWPLDHGSPQVQVRLRFQATLRCGEPVQLQIVGKDFLPAIALEEPVVGQGHGRFANCAMME